MKYGPWYESVTGLYFYETVLYLPSKNFGEIGIFENDGIVSSQIIIISPFHFRYTWMNSRRDRDLSRNGGLSSTLE